MALSARAITHGREDSMERGRDGPRMRAGLPTDSHEAHRTGRFKPRQAGQTDPTPCRPNDDRPPNSLRPSCSRVLGMADRRKRSNPDSHGSHRHLPERQKRKERDRLHRQKRLSGHNGCQRWRICLHRQGVDRDQDRQWLPWQGMVAIPPVKEPPFTRPAPRSSPRHLDCASRSNSSQSCP